MKQTLVLFSALLIALPCAAQEPVTLDLDVDGLIVDAPGEYSLPEHSFGSVPVRDEGPAQVLLSIVLGPWFSTRSSIPLYPPNNRNSRPEWCARKTGPFRFPTARPWSSSPNGRMTALRWIRPKSRMSTSRCTAHRWRTVNPTSSTAATGQSGAENIPRRLAPGSRSESRRLWVRSVIRVSIDVQDALHRAGITPEEIDVSAAAEPVGRGI